MRKKKDEEIEGTCCPLLFGASCRTNCMFYLTKSDAVEGFMSSYGFCSIAVLASHVASEQHVGGNYLAHFAEWTDLL